MGLCICIDSALSIHDFSAAWREEKWLRLRKHRVPEEHMKGMKGKKEDKKEFEKFIESLVVKVTWSPSQYLAPASKKSNS